MENYIEQSFWLAVFFVGIWFCHLLMRMIEFKARMKGDRASTRGWETIIERNEFDKKVRDSVPLDLYKTRAELVNEWDLVSIRHSLNEVSKPGFSEKYSIKRTK
jgi:hypothetical protein